jgi:hypothetical protein
MGGACGPLAVADTKIPIKGRAGVLKIIYTLFIRITLKIN